MYKNKFHFYTHILYKSMIVQHLPNEVNPNFFHLYNINIFLSCLHFFMQAFFNSYHRYQCTTSLCLLSLIFRFVYFTVKVP